MGTFIITEIQKKIKRYETEVDEEHSKKLV